MQALIPRQTFVLELYRGMLIIYSYVLELYRGMLIIYSYVLEQYRGMLIIYSYVLEHLSLIEECWLYIHMPLNCIVLEHLSLNCIEECWLYIHMSLNCIGCHSAAICLNVISKVPKCHFDWSPPVADPGGPQRPWPPSPKVRAYILHCLAPNKL